MLRNKGNILMFSYTTILYRYMKHRRNDVHNLFDNAHARNKIYHGIDCIANETRYIRVENFY